MHAAIVNTWGEAPTYSTIELPPPTATQVRIKIIAAGLHNLVRARAAGKHYSTAGTQPPHVPGVDGVGKIAETGDIVYFNCLTAKTGSFSEEINVEKRDTFPLIESANEDNIAVLANPAMSSWMALKARAGVKSGDKFTVAIIGATGISGSVAVQISKALGATQIIAIGKPGAKLDKTTSLGVSTTIALADKLEDTDFSAASDVNIVLDYLWGSVAKAALSGIIAKRKNKSQRLTWIEIGSLAGEELDVPASALRSTNIAFLGCGPGSWTFPELNQHLPEMLRAIAEHQLKSDFAIEKLSEVEGWWNQLGGPRKLVKP
ncbi:hypothetical protein B0J11DRAFT_530715 [Dendryphion nanum]|uniref:Quinone oxidoreductase n=1 Tax=Dendryphion nanum TaxID=256645 RepID=A0A9P9DSA0_9PLEO|nr:hypothetical protein B0J11DRAFT_530715 [Dendryphion nanum]